MGNKQYLSGRRFEYKRKAIWERDGYIVCRTAGSHSPFDLIAIKSMGDVVLVQCKTTKSSSVRKKLLREFREDPPLSPLGNYKQCMEVWDAKTRELYTWVI